MTVDDALPTTSLRRNTAIMAAGTATSRALGLVRTALLAAAIGVNAGAASAFDVANKLPGVLLTLLASGVLNAVLVPQVVRAMARKDGKQTVDRIVTLGTVAMLAITALLTAAAPLFILAYTSKFTPELTALTVAFALWTIPQLFFYGLYTLLGQILNARSRFGPFMWAPAANNLVAIAGLVAFLLLFGPYAIPAAGEDPVGLAGDWGPGKIAVLAGVATLGIVVQALVLIVPLRRSGYRWRWKWSGPKGELDGIKRVAGWALAAVLLEQVGIAVVTRVASSAFVVGGGSPDVATNTALTNALMLYFLPHSLVTVSIVTALFTGMSRLAAAGDLAGLRAELSRGLRTIGVFTVFATAALVVLAPLAVRVTLPSTPDVVVTSVAHVVVALAFGLAPLGAMILVKQAYLALEDARSLLLDSDPHDRDPHRRRPDRPGRSSTCTGGSSPPGAGMALSYAVSTALRLVGLRRRLSGLDGRRVASTHVRAVAAALPAAAAGVLLVRVIPDPRDLSRWAEVAARPGGASPSAPPWRWSMGRDSDSPRRRMAQRVLRPTPEARLPRTIAVDTTHAASGERPRAFRHHDCPAVRRRFRRALERPRRHRLGRPRRAPRRARHAPRRRVGRCGGHPRGAHARARSSDPGRGPSYVDVGIAARSPATTRVPARVRGGGTPRAVSVVDTSTRTRSPRPLPGSSFRWNGLRRSRLPQAAGLDHGALEVGAIGLHDAGPRGRGRGTRRGVWAPRGGRNGGGRREPGVDLPLARCSASPTPTGGRPRSPKI